MPTPDRCARKRRRLNRSVSRAVAACMVAMVLSMATAAGAAAAGKNAVENRCGWFVNPTPGNAWLIDRDGEWTIAVQGGPQAEGDWPPNFPAKQWVPLDDSGRGYGHGCACLRVRTDRGEQRITRIVSSQAKPLAQCRNDRALTEPRD